NYTKRSARLNTTLDLSDNLKIGNRVMLNLTNNGSLNAQSIYRNAILKGPNVKERNDVGEYYFGFDPNIRVMTDNPIAQAMRDRNYIKNFRAIGDVFIAYEPLEGLTLKSKIGIDYVHSEAYSRLIERPDLEGGSATKTTQS